MLSLLGTASTKSIWTISTMIELACSKLDLLVFYLSHIICCAANARQWLLLDSIIIWLAAAKLAIATCCSLNRFTSLGHRFLLSLVTIISRRQVHLLRHTYGLESQYFVFAVRCINIDWRLKVTNPSAIDSESIIILLSFWYRSFELRQTNFAANESSFRNLHFRVLS